MRESFLRAARTSERSSRGLLNREWTDEGAVYRDQRGNMVARFGRFEPLVDCLESLLDLESHSPRTLMSSKS
jgi:hypothetical protein